MSKHDSPLLLIERYLEKRQKQLGQHQGHALSEVQQGVFNILLMLYSMVKSDAERIYFAESTILMLNDYMENAIRLADAVVEDVAFPPILFLTFDQPYQVSGMPIAGFTFVSLYNEGVYRKLALGGNAPEALRATEAMAAMQGQYLLELVEPGGEATFYAEFSLMTGNWARTAWHVCPSGVCTQREEPCEQCTQALAFAGGMCLLSLLIRQRYFAENLYELKKVHTQRRVHDPKQTWKEKVVKAQHIFRVIDASVRMLPLETPQPISHYGSWVEQRLQDDPDSVVYVEKQVARTYRHPRYIHVQGETRIVQHKRVPRLKANLEQGVTKVIASTYEDHEA